LFVTAAFDKSSYQPGELVVVNGRVTAGGQAGPPVGNAQVDIEIDNPTGTVVYVGIVFTNSNGDYSTSFALGPSSENGSYSAFAVASKPGYSSGMASTNFQVIPEFSFGATWLLVLSTTVGLLLLRRRR
jgi:uncharacterized protein YfaS (alpha-2-macroglobulin family)